MGVPNEVVYVRKRHHKDNFAERLITRQRNTHMTTSQFKANAKKKKAHRDSKQQRV